MIDDFIKAWDENKEKLKKHIKSHQQKDYNTYKKIVYIIFEQIINPYLERKNKITFDLNKIHEIDDGEYQGTLIFIIPYDTYQPSYWQYVATFIHYGSCSGCDYLQGISHYDENFPTTEQTDEYMKLCLSILQHCKPPFNYED